MAWFACTSCGFDGHFTEFLEGEEMPDEGWQDDAPLECPECGSESVVED